ncbi:MAG: helix-turn-helix domain-containing protein [Planctomycetota bacterium]
MESKNLIDILTEFDDSPAARGFDLRLSFADLVLKRLEELGWNQADLARASGMKSAFISRLVNADQNCTLDTVGRVLHALDMRADIVRIGSGAFGQTRLDPGYVRFKGNQVSVVSDSYRTSTLAVPFDVEGNEHVQEA